MPAARTLPSVLHGRHPRLRHWLVTSSCGRAAASSAVVARSPLPPESSDLDLLGGGAGLDRVPELPPMMSGGGLVVETAVRERRRAAELVDDVVFGLVVLREPLLAVARVLVEVLVLHRVVEAALERRLRLVRLDRLATPRRGAQVVAVTSATRACRRPGTKPFLSHSFGIRRAAEVVDEVAPHQAGARAGGDDPARRRHRLKLGDLLVLLVDLLDRRAASSGPRASTFLSMYFLMSSFVPGPL